MLGARFRSNELNDLKRKSIVTSLGGSATWFDLDGDGDLDLFWVSATEQHLYRNDGGKLTDVTAASGALAKASGLNVGAVAGDYDNDGRTDLFLVRDGGFSLYHNDGAGKFSDVTATPVYRHIHFWRSELSIDIDHDGDLDFLSAGSSISQDSSRRARSQTISTGRQTCCCVTAAGSLRISRRLQR
jgi:hypothetical protein